MARGVGRRRGGERRRGRRAPAAGPAPDPAADGIDHPRDDEPAPTGTGALEGGAGSPTRAFQALLDGNPLGALVVDADRRVVLHNAPAAELFGAHRDDLVNERFPYPVTEAPAEISRRDASGAPRTHEVAWRPFDGLDRPGWLVTVRPVDEHPPGRGPAADEPHFGASTHDPLTGLPGRELLLNHVYEAALRSGELDVDRVALVVIDLERFGRINEEHGHAAGDRVLETVAARLTSAVRAGDYVSRIGGDEFAIVLPAQPLAAHRGITDRIEEVLARPIDVDGAEVACTPVIGMAEHVPEDDEHSLLERATAAMVTSEPGATNVAPRPAARAEVAAATPAIHTSGRVDEGELLLHFQPVFALADGTVSSLEALARWDHPDDGLVVPDESTRVELEGGSVLGVGEWIIREACEQLATWRRDLPDYVVPPVSVNLSARELGSTAIHTHVLAELARHDLPAGALRFEIPEAVLLDRDPRVEVLLRAIAADGIGLVLDAFGTGLASLTHLQVFPLAGVKIDRSFVTRMMTDGPSGQVVLAAIDAGRTFEVPVTAVGVETAEQRSALERLGCDHAQGYFLARPVTAVEATRFFDRDPASIRARPGGPLLRSSGAYPRPTLP